MIELLHTDTLNDARAKLARAAENFVFDQETVSCTNALGRVCARDVIAAENVPPFRRSTVDGYAVLARDTYGAGEASPVFFQVAGAVAIEAHTDMHLTRGKAMQVQTGSMVPDGADAVLMTEYTQVYAPGKMIGYKAVSEGENVIEAGEDIAKGDCLFKKGHRINARDIGTMAALGICEVPVFVPPSVTVISTGDELADIDAPLTASQIRDINTYALTAEASASGMMVRKTVRTKDDEAEIMEAVVEAMAESDIVILSGGSSKGNKDYTKKVLTSAAGSVLTHGIAIKPGKPTILAYDPRSRTVLAGLPGHPMAAVLMFRLVVVHWYFEKVGIERPMPYFAKISENVSSNQGRETCLPVRLLRNGDALTAVPVHAKSGSIAALGRADGYVMIPRDREGLKKDACVRVEVL